ncbi:hypothetical protein PPS11_24643 [Pseudomonas putida S11]|nr:hypothetical protein PPS11_24643 [Pseudomonas putida S11]
MVLALLPGLIALGCWQLGRAEEKRVLLAAYAERRVEAPVATAQLTANQDNAFRRVHLYGRFDAEHSLLLDNRMRDGQAGVELLQPFHDQASGVWLLVNRGWLPWPDRRVPVHFDTPAQALALDASVYVAPGSTFQLHPDPAGGQWPHLLTAVDAAQLWQQLDRDGFAHELRLEPGPATYRLDWPVVAMGPVKTPGLRRAMVCPGNHFGTALPLLRLAPQQGETPWPPPLHWKCLNAANPEPAGVCSCC